MIKLSGKRWMLLILAGTILKLMNCAHTFSSQNAKTDLDAWPDDCSPREIGKRVAENFLARPHWNSDPNKESDFIKYPESCAWYGALAFAQASSDEYLKARLIQRFEPLLTEEESHLVPEANHVDLSVFGIVPLEIFFQNHDQRCLDLGKSMAERQWENPAKEGLSPQTRFWIDDMYMIIALQAQAFRATEDITYLNRAALEMVTYLDSLQQANGLFYHAPDAPFFWGRGNGWVAVGMTELLRDLRASHPLRPRILKSYRKMMAALLKYQDANGMWHQLIDKSDVWPETSCTGMFSFAMITGAKSGWLDEKKFGPAARKGWLGLVSYIDNEANIREVCEGTGKRNDENHYLNRKRRIGDLHGQAPILWCAAALLR
jgi:unsaturated rhamnogalacturonyl hydrolase